MNDNCIVRILLERMYKMPINNSIYILLCSVFLKKPKIIFQVLSINNQTKEYRKYSTESIEKNIQYSKSI